MTSAADLEPAPGTLLHNLLLFGRLLRRLGLDVNPGKMIDLVEALQHVDIARRSDFYYTLRTFLIHRHDQIALFDQAFKLFWRKPQGNGVELALFDAIRARKPQKPEFVQPSPEQALGLESSALGENEQARELIEVIQTYSTQERLREKDFGEMSREEAEEVRRFMSELVWQLGQKRTRRFHPGRSARLDLRRLMRKNLRYGGELIELPSRRRKVKPRPLVIVADVSGSMESYTKLLLYFVYSLLEGLTQRVEAFVFSTRLSRITHELHNRELEAALQRVARSVPDWSGGTRIGNALKRFNFKWGRRVLGHGAVVILISDGWDRGDPDILGREMARLQRSCYRLIWLNPLLGSPRYEPVTRGMQAALPYVDDFLPVHNLASLEALGKHLQKLDTERRGRGIPARAIASFRTSTVS